MRLYQIAIAMSTTGALMSTAHATTYTWVNAGVVGTNYGGGSWNDTTANNTANWDTNGVPSNDGTADVVLSLSHNGWPMYAVNPASLTGNPTNWSINSLNYINSGTQADWGAPYIYGPSGYNDTRYSLSIGAGGINQNMLSSPEIGVPIIATASQPWNINNMAGNYTGGLTVKGNLTINNGVLITKNNGTSTTTPPTAWFSGGVVPSQVAFYNGTTTTVGTGAFALTGGGFLFSGVVAGHVVDVPWLGSRGDDRHPDFRGTQHVLIDATGTYAQRVSGVIISTGAIDVGRAPICLGATVDVVEAIDRPVGGISGQGCWIHRIHRPAIVGQTEDHISCAVVGRNAIGVPVSRIISGGIIPAPTPVIGANNARINPSVGSGMGGGHQRACGGHGDGDLIESQ